MTTTGDPDERQSDRPTAAQPLTGRVALVTGAGSGIGRSIARELSRGGADVILVGRQLARLEEISSEISPRGHVVAQDVDRLDELPDVVAREGSDVGPISILVHCAGGHLSKPATDTTDQDLDEMLLTHVRAGFALTRLVIPQMERVGRGSIIYIASMAAVLGLPRVAAYSAAKSAMVGLARSLAVELAPKGIRANVIVPGWIESGMTQGAFNVDPARRSRVVERTPMKRLGSPDEISEAAMFLASDASSFVTGSCVTVDGGASISL